MRKSVRFHPAAVMDAEEAAAWYAARSNHSSDKFVQEFERLVRQIALSPLRFPALGSGLRKAVFRRFPYGLVFEVETSEILVLAVAHAKRRPGYWRDRRGV